MELKSTVFQNNNRIPIKYTCDGENINPRLEIINVPKESKCLVLIMEDPDAVSKENFTHWLLYNIPPSTSKILENQIPDGSIEGVNDFGGVGYSGPCPPSGMHRYLFKLYALGITLGTSQEARKEEIINKMMDHILETAELTGLYSR